MNTFIGLRPKLKAEFEDGHGSSKHWVLVTLSGHGLGRKHEEVHELWPALLPLSLGIVKSQRTGPLNSMSLLIRKKMIWLKAVNLTKLYLKKVMTASTVQLRTDALSESPSEVTRLQRNGYILMQPFNFRISSQSAFSEKEFSLGFGPFSCFLREERKEKGRQLEANRDAQRDTEGETSNKNCRDHRSPIRYTCSRSRRQEGAIR